MTGPEPPVSTLVQFRLQKSSTQHAEQTGADRFTLFPKVVIARLIGEHYKLTY